jgi:hypothetical protein
MEDQSMIELVQQVNELLGISDADAYEQQALSFLLASPVDRAKVVEQVTEQTELLFQAIGAQADVWMLLTAICCIAIYAQGDLLIKGIEPYLERLTGAAGRAIAKNDLFVRSGQPSILDVEGLQSLVSDYVDGIRAALVGDGGQALRNRAKQFNDDIAELRRKERVGRKNWMSPLRQTIAKEASKLKSKNNPFNEKTYREVADTLMARIQDGALADPSGEIKAWLDKLDPKATKLGNLVRQYERYLEQRILFP